jgi:hypothetical protein
MSNWELLKDEIEQWQQPVNFWWRDDDAIKNTDALQTMLQLAVNHKTAVHLAVIPNQLQPSLSILKSPKNKPFSYVLQHGVEHKSYALANQRKIELGGSQDSTVLRHALANGRDTLKGAFDQQYLDILVPPWNRIADDIVETLSDIGYRKLSVLGSAKLIETQYQLNVNIDIINWKTRTFAGESVVLDKIISHLQNKRLNLQTGSGDILANNRPCGLMTHHLDHDDKCWQFLDDFFTFCQAFKQIQWLSGKTLYSL